MFDTLFGAEMPLAVSFFLAFLVVLGLIGVTAGRCAASAPAGSVAPARAAASRGLPSSIMPASTAAAASSWCGATMSSIC